MALLPSPPPDATTALRGLVNTLAQSFEGQKTFRLATAASGERALTVGTSVADASVNEAFRLFSARTGIGGTEKEWFDVRRPVNYGSSVVNIDQQLVTNTIAINIANAGAGLSGIRAYGGGGLGQMQLTAGQSGAPVQLYAENKGLVLAQNANSYNSDTLMRFRVDGPTGVAASVPVFDFVASAALGASQDLARFRANAKDSLRVTSTGVVIGNGVSAIGLSTVEGSYILDTGNIRAATLNSTAYIGTSVAGAFKFYADGSGQISQVGAVSGAIGADTRNVALGTNTLASGATSVTITNSLVTTSTPVFVTFHADPGGRVWVTRAAGSFTVNVSSAPGANAPFSWEVKALLP